MAGDSSHEEIEQAAMTSGMPMAVAGVGAGNGERAREGVRQLQRVCAGCASIGRRRGRGTRMMLSSQTINGRYEMELEVGDDS